MADFSIANDVLMMNANIVTSGRGIPTCHNESKKPFTIRTLRAGPNIDIYEADGSIYIESFATGSGGKEEYSAVTIGNSIVVLARVRVRDNTITSFRFTIVSGNSTDKMGSRHDLDTVFKNVEGDIQQIDPPATVMDWSESGYNMDSGKINFTESEGYLIVQVTGLPSKTINWKCAVDRTEVFIG